MSLTKQKGDRHIAEEKYKFTRSTGGRGQAVERGGETDAERDAGAYGT